MHRARRAQAVAIARTQDAAKVMRLRLLLVSFGATTAILALLTSF